jgi:hypothetical protein
MKKELKKITFVFLFFLFASMLFFSGCKNPFKTRKSPEPKGQIGTWDTPVEPKVVIQNLLFAYNEKIIENFNTCICDTFKFSAPEDSIKPGRPELFSNWDAGTEKMITGNLFDFFRENSDSVDYFLFIDFDTYREDKDADTLAIVTVNYTITIHQFKLEGEEPREAKGVATFYLKQTSLNWWSIFFWSDIPDTPDGYDWAAFKAQFREFLF